jgi:hypothetical protein
MNFSCGTCFAVSSPTAWDKETEKAYCPDPEEGACEKIMHAYTAEDFQVVAFACPVCHDICAMPSPVECKP